MRADPDRVVLLFTLVVGALMVAFWRVIAS